jgi:hypothetical protein
MAVQPACIEKKGKQVRETMEKEDEVRKVQQLKV